VISIRQKLIPDLVEFSIEQFCLLALTVKLSLENRLTFETVGAFSF